MAEPIEQAPEWVRALATPAHELAQMRAEALAEIAKWKRGEPSRVMTFEELFAWLDALDAADEDADAGPDAAAHPGPRVRVRSWRRDVVRRGAAAEAHWR